jgi:hypothetical protein
MLSAVTDDTPAALLFVALPVTLKARWSWQPAYSEPLRLYHLLGRRGVVCSGQQA